VVDVKSCLWELPKSVPVSQQVLSEAVNQKADTVPTHMFALIVEVEVLVLDLRYVCLNGVSEMSARKIAWQIHFCDVTLVRLFDRLFVPFLVNQIDETLISVQRDLLLEMTASGTHLDGRFSPQQNNSEAGYLQSPVGP
jgi:hypothetical protein